MNVNSGIDHGGAIESLKVSREELQEKLDSLLRGKDVLVQLKIIWERMRVDIEAILNGDNELGLAMQQFSELYTDANSGQKRIGLRMGDANFVGGTRLQIGNVDTALKNFLGFSKGANADGLDRRIAELDLEITKLERQLLGGTV